MKKAFLPILLILLTTTLGAQEQDLSGLDCSIRLYDKAIYYPDSSLMVKITLTNNSAKGISFKIADRKLFSFDFDIRTMSNARVAESDFFITHRLQNQPVFYREIMLLPGEEYAVIEDLRDYRQLDQPGTYVVQALFYPQLGNKDLVIKSNRILVTIHPGMDILREAEIRVEEQTREILTAQPMPPDMVVKNVIEARQKNQWERFFLYMDIESLFMRDRSRKAAYLKAGEEERLRMLDTFRKELTSSVVDRDIIVIPQEYEIVKTEYTQKEGKVVVIEKFDYGTYKEVKEYTYMLKKKDNIWYITDYNVHNMGTE
ncbi:hypothetical protein WKV44_05175 [Spirochaetia bacterium 38H-sp]|uniref:Uncharacterized protein n=1 Tax=Rarispira pelagica TaxID=3141764 RepID=A0ABU9UCQ4_9SPIR